MRALQTAEATQPWHSGHEAGVPREIGNFTNQKPRMSRIRDTGPEVPSSAEQFADDLGGVVHHRDDAGIVEPRRPDHSQNADDLPGRIVVRSHDG